MSETKKVLRLPSVAKKFNVGVKTLVEFLNDKGYDEVNARTKLTEEMYESVREAFAEDQEIREKAEQINLGGVARKDVLIEDKKKEPGKKDDTPGDEVLIKSSTVTPPVEPAKEEPEQKEEKPKKEEEKEEKKEEQPAAKEEEATAEETEKAKVGPKVVGKVDLDEVSGKKKKGKAAEEKKEEEKEEAKEEEKKPAAKEEAPAKKEEKAEEPPAEEAPKAKQQKEEKDEEPEFKQTEKIDLRGPKIVGKINLPKEEKRTKKEDKKDEDKPRRRRRKRIVKSEKVDPRRADGKKGKKKGKQQEDEQVSEKEIEEKIKKTMAKLGGGAKGKGARAKLRRQKREDHAEKREEQETQNEGVLEVTEFISVSELASMMGVSATEVISKCMELGIIVSINQRLDAEIIELLTDEFGFEVKFHDVTDEEDVEEEEEDDPADLQPRAPIITVMGHVDHGKTSLLDHVRRENVAEGEAGGITQHIGAYEVEAEDGRKIVFLDTPGHEAFTAMRARGAKATDVAVIVIAADDSVMPQTREAISHAQAAGVPMVFAINKIDKDGANPDKIKEELANMNLLVEDWGGKFQCQEISAKKGIGIDELMEKILLESELLELQANPDKEASGVVIEASLDKGRGYVATILVQAGTLQVGDFMVAGTSMGKVKAMFNEKGQQSEEAGPSTAVQILGLDGAPQAGEVFKIYESEQEAKALVNKRKQIIREQGMRTKKHITLDEIGRRLALGTFKELNIIIKGDVDGSVEALSDSLQKLSTEEIVVNVVHRGVGQITESDVLLASASDAIIIGFQVRPSVSARRLAEKENIEIRMYSIIYNAIEELRTAMEGMLEPTIEEKVLGNLEVKEVFKISKVGTVAGCEVIDGKVTRAAKVRVVRDGIVVYTGELESLKRYKDDVKEVIQGQECGMNIKDFNDIKKGDIIESFTETEVKRSLS